MREGRHNTDPPQKSLAELLGDLSKDVSLLVHEGVQLAKVELTDETKKLAAGAVMFVVAGVLGLLGVGVLSACCVIVLAIVWPFWLASVVVGAPSWGPGLCLHLAVWLRSARHRLQYRKRPWRAPRRTWRGFKSS